MLITALTGYADIKKKYIVSNLKLLFLNINSNASSIKSFENRSGIKLVLLFHQCEIASNPRFIGIDVYRLSISHEYNVAS